MEKNEFLTTGWPLAKPFLLKAQGLDAKNDQPGAEIPGQPEEPVSEVKFKVLVGVSSR